MPIFGNALRIHEQRSTGTHWLLVEFPILVNEIFFFVGQDSLVLLLQTCHMGFEKRRYPNIP